MNSIYELLKGLWITFCPKKTDQFIHSLALQRLSIWCNVLKFWKITTHFRARILSVTLSTKSQSVQANSKQNLRCSKCLVTFQMTCAYMTSDITHNVTERSSRVGGISTDIDCSAVSLYLLMEYLVNMKICSICCNWYRMFIQYNIRLNILKIKIFYLEST